MLEDSLKEKKKKLKGASIPKGEGTNEGDPHSHLPLLDLGPQMPELLQIEPTCPVHLDAGS